MAGCEPMALPGEIVSELQCPVCWNQATLHLLPCSHQFCNDCLIGVAKGRGMMNCPTCRRSLAVPSGGFPICVLAEHLRDQVENAAKPSINAVKPKSSVVCSACVVHAVEAQCSLCHSLLCFRCSVAKADCKYAESGRHHADPLDEVLKVKQERLEKWKTKISGEIDRRESELRDAEEALRQKRKELDDKKSLLKATELTESGSDRASLIKMIDQLCTPDGVSASASKSDTLKLDNS